MGAFDHILNVLDIALKAGDRRAAESQAERMTRSRAKTRIKGFGEKSEPKKDPWCCIVKRDPNTGGQP